MNLLTLVLRKEERSFVPLSILNGFWSPTIQRELQHEKLLSRSMQQLERRRCKRRQTLTT